MNKAGAVIEGMPTDALVQVIAIGLPVAVVAVLIALLLNRKRPPRQAAEGVGADEGIRPAESPAASLTLAANGAADLRAQIATAETSGVKTGLADLYLALAAEEALQNNPAARLAALRSAAGNGALHGPAEAHARARLELAEVAVEAGDLTSACEQWQMARTALRAHGDMAAHDAVEKRMRDNGCPTDWVLTDF